MIMRITLEDNEYNPEINFESEIIFNNGDKLFIQGIAIILSNRFYDIKEDLSGIERVTYNYNEIS